MSRYRRAGRGKERRTARSDRGAPCNRTLSRTTGGASSARSAVREPVGSTENSPSRRIETGRWSWPRAGLAFFTHVKRNSGRGLGDHHRLELSLERREDGVEELRVHLEDHVLEPERLGRAMCVRDGAT